MSSLVCCATVESQKSVHEMYVTVDEKPIPVCARKFGDEAIFIKIGVVVHTFQLQFKTCVIEYKDI